MLDWLADQWQLLRETYARRASIRAVERALNGGDTDVAQKAIDRFARVLAQRSPRRILRMEARGGLTE